MSYKQLAIVELEKQQRIKCMTDSRLMKDEVRSGDQRNPQIVLTYVVVAVMITGKDTTIGHASSI